MLSLLCAFVSLCMLCVCTKHVCTIMFVQDKTRKICVSGARDMVGWHQTCVMCRLCATRHVPLSVSLSSSV
jgi:hypothetical protein